MALEAVVYPKDYNPFSYVCKDFYSINPASNWGYDFSLQDDIQDKAHVGLVDHHHHQVTVSLNETWDYNNCSLSPPSLLQNVKEWDPHSSPDEEALEIAPPPPATTTGRRKRRRTRSCKNKEEMENQRMTHIVVERNRRKQMNEYLAVLRSLMPTSYVQRGDQASIIGGAINFVKELEQLLQSIDGSHKRATDPKQVPLAEFFSFPQFSTAATIQCNRNTSSSSSSSSSGGVQGNDEPYMTGRSNNNNNSQWAAADIEVTMVDSHAHLKILSKKRPRQLLKMVAGIQSLRLTVLHLNVTTVDEMVLYSVSVKIEEGCMLNTVDEIAAAVNEMLRRIQEASFS